MLKSQSNNAIKKCLTAPSHYLNQLWLPISEVLCHSPESNFTASGQAIILHNVCEIYTFQIILILLKLLLNLRRTNEFGVRLSYHREAYGGVMVQLLGGCQLSSDNHAWIMRSVFFGFVLWLSSFFFRDINIWGCHSQVKYYKELYDIIQHLKRWDIYGWVPESLYLNYEDMRYWDRLSEMHVWISNRSRWYGIYYFFSDSKSTLRNLGKYRTSNRTTTKQTTPKPCD